MHCSLHAGVYCDHSICLEAQGLSEESIKVMVVRVRSAMVMLVLLHGCGITGDDSELFDAMANSKLSSDGISGVVDEIAGVCDD